MATDAQLVQFRAFVAVSRLQSYALAAEELSYSEPAVYLQLKGLEKALGLRLVRRQRKQVLLTTEGQGILPHVIDLLERADVVAQSARGLTGHIVVASGSNTAVSWVMPIISRYQMDFPNHEVQVESGDAREIIEGVTHGRVDIGIGGLRREAMPPTYLATHRLVLAPWVRDRWVVFGSVGLVPRLRRKELPLPLRVFHYPQWTRIPMEEATRSVSQELGLPIRLSEMGSLELVRGAVMNDLGLGIIPESATRFLEARRVVKVCNLGDYSEFWLRLMHRRPRLLAEPVRTFLCYLIREREAFGSAAPEAADAQRTTSSDQG